MSQGVLASARQAPGGLALPEVACMGCPSVHVGPSEERLDGGVRLAQFHSREESRTAPRAASYPALRSLSSTQPRTLVRRAPPLPLWTTSPRVSLSSSQARLPHSSRGHGGLPWTVRSRQTNAAG